MNHEVEFDAGGLVAKAAKASVDVLRRMGAYVRRVAQSKVRQSIKPSSPGSPPHTRRGALKRGILFGVEFVGGILVGATIVAIPRSLFMGNSGGAFDNAKKYIESGSLKGHGKGSAAHKAAVTGDTVGDTRKDVVGVALDIFIKTMSTVANTLASVFSHFTLFR